MSTNIKLIINLVIPLWKTLGVWMLSYFPPPLLQLLFLFLRMCSNKFVVFSSTAVKKLQMTPARSAVCRIKPGPACAQLVCCFSTHKTAEKRRVCALRCVLFITAGSCLHRKTVYCLVNTNGHNAEEWNWAFFLYRSHWSLGLILKNETWYLLYWYFGIDPPAHSYRSMKELIDSKGQSRITIWVRARVLSALRTPVCCGCRPADE